MERYFSLYPGNENRAMLHYRCNLQLAEAFYVSLSVLEVTLRNALCRELETMTGRADWYAVFPTTPGLAKLNRYITQASKQIAGRHERYYPFKSRGRTDIGVLGVVVEQRVRASVVERPAPCVPFYA